MTDHRARMQQLQRIGMGCSWKPQDWHLKLVAYLEPMLVYGTYGNAGIRREGTSTFLLFTEPHKVSAARSHMPLLEACFGGPVALELAALKKNHEYLQAKNLQEGIAKAELRRKNFRERGIEQ
jgi:hypothetical protein